MTLYIMRHAIAVERGTPGYSKDCDRPLTPKGERKLQKVTAGLMALGVTVDVIISSPYARARQTAEIVAERFQKRRRLELWDELAPKGKPEELIRRLLGHLPYSKSILLIGHEPYLGRLISMLVTGQPNLPFKLKKAGVCRLSCETLRYARCAQMEWMATPRHLAKAA